MVEITREIHRHALLDAPFHQGIADATIISHAGSKTGRFIFTEGQPAFHIPQGEIAKLRNLTVIGSENMPYPFMVDL